METVNHYRLHELIKEDCVTGGMTNEERQWCINEADDAGEGYFSHSELEAMTDSQLAAAVIEAQTMYVNTHF